MTEKNHFRLSEREFDISNLLSSKIGKVVVISTPNSLAVRGILRQYSRGDFAVLKPWIYYPGKDERPVIMNRDAIIEGSPVTVSELDCDSLEEYIEKYEIKKKHIVIAR